jgi:hypothetical protein
LKATKVRILFIAVKTVQQKIPLHVWIFRILAWISPFLFYTDPYNNMKSNKRAVVGDKRQLFDKILFLILTKGQATVLDEPVELVWK